MAPPRVVLASPSAPSPTPLRKRSLSVTRTASVVPLIPAWRVDKTFDYSVPDELAAAVEVGSLVRARFGGRRIRAVVVSLRERHEGEGLEPLAGVVGPAPVTPPPIGELFEWLARRYVVPLGKAFARAVPPRVRVALGERAPLEAMPATVVGSYAGGRELLGTIQEGKTGVWVFEARPGDDRGVIVSDLVGSALRSADGAAIVCVPEVHHGSRVLDALSERFPDLARLDSSVSDGDRSRATYLLARRHRLGAGGRGAVLAPAPDLRLIVIDEEHHRTYKEDRAPRYDARRVAIERSIRQGAVCVLLSTTPSVESGARVLRGEYRSVAPTREASKASRPLIEIAGKDPDRAVTALLHRRIKETLEADGRVALLAPARGYARSVWCAQCRLSLRCPRCEAGMFLDREPNRLRCPRCGYTSTPPDSCPNCSGTEFRWLGAGSQRLADQLARSFPRVRVVHVDPSSIDSAAERGSAADIYVTTWIGTKAAVRPPVSLVGVIDADALIRRPHYSSAEQAFHALGEMSEWAGPASAGGRLVIQGDEPNHYVLQSLMRADYRFFLERELQQREELGYPPFCELVRVRITGTDAGMSERVASEAREVGATVLGPIPVARENEPTSEMLIKAPDAEAVAARLRVILPQTPPKTRVLVDVDPR